MAQECESCYTGCGSSMVLRTTTMGYDDSEIKKKCFIDGGS